MNRPQDVATPRQQTETALYFPYIRVPRTPWFTQVLLYWDKAASIVPEELVYQPDGLNPYMRELNREGLLDFIDPNHAVDYRDLDAFDNNFMALLDHAEPPPPEENRTYAKVHVDKMSYGLCSKLYEKGLARPPEDPPKSWRQVETTTANTFMAYLASVISGDLGNTLPVTDQLDDLSTLGPTSGGSRSRLAPLRYAAVTRALPAPQGEVSAAEIVDFKEKHGEQLRRCRRYLDKKLADLASDQDPDAPREIREAKEAWVLQEIEDEVAALREKMERRRWTGVALVGFGGVTATVLGIGAALLAGGAPLVVGLGVAANVLQFGGAAKGAVDLLREPRFNSRSPLAYAALATQQFN